MTFSFIQRLMGWLETVAGQRSVEWWRTSLVIFGSLGLFLALVFGVLSLLAKNSIDVLTAKKAKEDKALADLEKKKSSKSGMISPKNAAPRNGDVVVRFGGSAGISMLVKRQHLESGTAAMPFMGDSELAYPLILKVTDGKLFVSYKFLDLDGKNIFSLTDNEWEVHNQNINSNYDDTGFEFIDEYGIMKLQVDFIDNATIRIAGFLRTSTGFVYSTDRGFGLIAYPSQAVSEKEKVKFREHSSTIRDMFRYPRELHFGVRVPPVVPPEELPFQRHFADYIEWYNDGTVATQWKTMVVNVAWKYDMESVRFANEAVAYFKSKGIRIEGDSATMLWLTQPSPGQLGTIQLTGTIYNRTGRLVIYPLSY